MATFDGVVVELDSDGNEIEFPSLYIDDIDMFG